MKHSLDPNDEAYVHEQYTLSMAEVNKDISEYLSTFGKEDFSPRRHAQSLFADHGEDEIQQRITSMAKVQARLETHLRESVRQNYKLFINLGREVDGVEEQLSSAKALLEASQQRMAAVVAFCDREMINNELTENNSDDDLSNSSLAAAIDDILGTSSSSSSSTRLGAPTLPAWVRDSPKHLRMAMVERDYARAVDIIRQLRTFQSAGGFSDDAPKKRGPGDPHPTDPDGWEGAGSSSRAATIAATVADVMAVAESTAEELVCVLLASLQTIPNVPLWGEGERSSRLQLLIMLGQAGIAADGFLTGQSASIARAVRTLSPSGQPLLYSSEVTTVFVLALRSALSAFLEIFCGAVDTSSEHVAEIQDERGDEVSSVASELGQGTKSLPMLLSWMHQQAAAYVSVFSRQVLRDAGHAVDIFFSRCQDSVVHQVSVLSSIGLSQGSLTPGGTGRRSPSSSPHPGGGDEGNIDDEEGMETASLLSSHDQPPGGLGMRDSFAPQHCGPMSLTLACMHEALSCTILGHSGAAVGAAASVAVSEKEGTLSLSPLAKALELECVSSMRLLFLPVLRSVIVSFSDDIIDELEECVTHESWMLVNCTAPGLQAAHASAGGDEKEIKAPSAAKALMLPASYVWLVVALNAYIRDMRALHFQSQATLLPAAGGGTAAGTAAHTAMGDEPESEAGGFLRHCDVAGVEPDVVASVLRIVVRYIRLMEITIDLGRDLDVNFSPTAGGTEAHPTLTPTSTTSTTGDGGRTRVESADVADATHRSRSRLSSLGNTPTPNGKADGHVGHDDADREGASAINEAQSMHLAGTAILTYLLPSLAAALAPFYSGSHNVRKVVKTLTRRAGEMWGNDVERTGV